MCIRDRHQPVRLHAPAFQPVEKTHAEQVGLHLSARHHQCRHRLLDQMAHREPIQRQPRRLGMTARGFDVDVVFEHLERQADRFCGFPGQHHRCGAGIDHHRRLDAVNLGAEGEFAGVAARDLNGRGRRHAATSHEVRQLFAGARELVGFAIGDHGADGSGEHQHDEQDAAHGAPPMLRPIARSVSRVRAAALPVRGRPPPCAPPARP